SNSVTYHIESCAGINCANFVEIGTATATIFASNGLTSSTNYSYRVRASDPSNNFSNYSNIASTVTASGPPPAPDFVQANFAVPPNPNKSVPVSFTKPQSAGNTNVVAINWFDTVTSIASITDTAGTTYIPAMGPISVSGTGTLSIYYATNIAQSA